MNSSFQYRYLWLVILGLLLLNLGLLGWIWLSPQNHPRTGQSPADFLEKELDFTTKQKEQYRLLREGHHSKVKTLRDSVRQMKKQFFEQLGKSMTDSAIEQVTADMAKKVTLLDKITFQHFRDVRQICTPSQQQKFDEIIDEMLHRMAAGSEGRGGLPPQDGSPHGGPPPRE